MTSSVSMRPTSWDDYQGQEKLKNDLQIRIQAANDQGRMLDHVLMIADPGYGKTSLATLIASELADPMVSFVMPITDRDMRNILLSADGMILFFDEIHRLKPAQQENLLTVLEDGTWQEGWKTVDLPPMTIIAATTEAAEVLPTVQDRFKIKPTFEPYTPQEMAQIAMRMAERVGLTISEEAAEAIGYGGAGSPRQVEDLILAARDLGSAEDVGAVFSLCNLTLEGLNPLHLAYLAILEKYSVAGMDVLCSTMRQSKGYLMDLERILTRMDLIERTPRGRQLSANGYKFMNTNNKRGI